VLSAKDRRVKLVEMTEKGATFFQKMVAEHEKWLINIFKDLKYDELNMLVSLLNRLRKVTLKNIKAK
jgi:DNA-binding MarR family transcriptional regulator